jgi:diguanylate cyclase (GGDEF)-like protein
VVIAGAVGTALLMVATALALDPAAVLASPPTLILPLFTLASVTLLATAVRRASIDLRRAAGVDGLTGALNRTSLRTRSAELHHQTTLTGEPVAVVVVDIDHFKLVNDLYGHPGGDRVLVALVELLREVVGVRGQIYRMGGEEFAVLLPGLTGAAAVLVAEDLAQAVRSAPLGGIAVTVSLGVAASVSGGAFHFDVVFAAADEALYAAKRSGRDAVRIVDQVA